jgi:nucleotide-binding universal stress UspA family protein
MFYYIDTEGYLQSVYAFMQQNGDSNGGAVMWDRLLLAIDQYESGQTALRFTAELAALTSADVRVLHVRELSGLARVPPIETPAEADTLVEEAVFSLRLAGVGAEGRACSFLEDQVPFRIVEESLYWICDAIVLGTRRLRGVSRLSGRGVRDRVIRLTILPVLAAPTPLNNGIYGPGRFRSKPRNDNGAKTSFRRLD